MVRDIEFDTNAGIFGPEAWEAEVACYRNSLTIANLENDIVQAKTREEFETLFDMLIEAQERRRELGYQKAMAMVRHSTRKEDVR